MKYSLPVTWYPVFLTKRPLDLVFNKAATIVLGRISSRHIVWFSHINICIVTKQIRDKTIRKDRQCKFIFLLSPSLDPINIIFVRALEAMKVAGEALQGNRRTSPAAGSYLQPRSKEMATHESASEKTIWRLEIILRTIAIKRRARNIRKNFRTAPYFIMHAHTHLRSDALLRGLSVCWNEPATGPLGEKISASRFKLYF